MRYCLPCLSVLGERAQVLVCSGYHMMRMGHALRALAQHSTAVPWMGGRSLVAVQRAPLCTEASQPELESFLVAASRPIMGKAKARQSAGQKALDLTKQLNRLKDFDIPTLLRASSKQLKDVGVPVQERKRLLNFLNKYKQGYRHDGREGPKAWLGWQPPYRQANHPMNSDGSGRYQRED